MVCAAAHTLRQIAQLFGRQQLCRRASGLQEQAHQLVGLLGQLAAAHRYGRHVLSEIDQIGLGGNQYVDLLVRRGPALLHIGQYGLRIARRRRHGSAREFATIGKCIKIGCEAGAAVLQLAESGIGTPRSTVGRLGDSLRMELHFRRCGNVVV